MKKHLIMSFLFLLLATPVLAKGSSGGQPSNEANSTSGTQSGSGSNTQVAPTNKPTIRVTSTQKPLATPTGNQVQNQVQTQNQGESQQLTVKTQETEQLNQNVTQSFTKVSDQVKQLVETTGAKGGIGQEVKTIAQNQTKLQNEIKADFDNLNSRGVIAKLMIGSDKKITRSLEQKMEQNRLIIQQLEQLKLQTKNTGDLQQLQETIDLMIYQNTSLQSKIDKESKANGLFGWITNLFNK